MRAPPPPRAAETHMPPPAEPLAPASAGDASDASLPEVRGGSRAYLDATVALFAKTFKADRAALYLYDEEANSLSMRAALGFPMFGKATIVVKLGEGLAGRALAERRPIYTEMASSMRGYVSHPNFPDGDTQTFLGIPLLRGRERIGVVALYRRTGHPFLAEEISAARLKASEMADAIQSAGALLLAEHGAAAAAAIAARSGVLVPTEQMAFRGSAVSNGWAMGPVRVAKAKLSLAPAGGGEGAPRQPAVRWLDEAVRIVEERLRVLAADLDKRIPEAASMLLDADVMMLHDESFAGRIAKLASDEGVPLADAIARVASDFIALFEASDTEYLREKARDVEDLALRLLEAATDADPWKADETRAASIVVAEKMLPSDVLRVARDRAAGIVLCAGGATAHVSLLVRSLRIPTLIVKTREPLRLPDGERAILDCANETLYVHPDEALERRFRSRARDEAADFRLARPASDHTATRDGETIRLEANINLLADLDAAVEAHAAGVGLYRTEFPYLMRPSLPSENDQLAIYRRVLERMPGRPVTFRTLDAGGDKGVPYLYKEKEENPALGLRSIRLSLKFPDVFDQQLRAILRAMQEGGRDDVSIMFPMISSVEEFRAARERVETCLAALHTELGDRPMHDPWIGAMIEVPAAIGIADALAEECDFFSIGTNDLIQYTLAVDRTNAAVAPNYVPHHPAVLRAIRVAAGAAARHGIPCAVCGEMGRDPRYLPFFVGLGVRTFSLEPTQIPKCQELVARLTIPQCRQYASRLLAQTTVAGIEAAIDEFQRATWG